MESVGGLEVHIEDIRAAERRLAGVAVRTPLVPLAGPGDVANIWLKPETLQPIGSFKLRGAYNALAHRAEKEQLTGASTLSAGNMSQAVAWSAQQLGIPSAAIMPAGAPEMKVGATQHYGAEIEFIPRDEMFAAMDDGRFDDRSGFVHPFNDRDVVAGHGTIGVEILEDIPDVDTVIVPVGSGGLLIGIATALKAARPEVCVLGVQPSGLSGLAVSLEAGEPRTVQGTSFVDGAGAPFVMRSMFPALQRLADGCLMVDDDQTRAALRRLAIHNKLIAEGAGALSVAAALSLAPEERGRTVCIVSGGSIDPALLAQIVASG